MIFNIASIVVKSVGGSRDRFRFFVEPGGGGAWRSRKRELVSSSICKYTTTSASGCRFH